MVLFCVGRGGFAGAAPPDYLRRPLLVETREYVLEGCRRFLVVVFALLAEVRRGGGVFCRMQHRPSLCVCAESSRRSLLAAVWVLDGFLTFLGDEFMFGGL